MNTYEALDKALDYLNCGIIEYISESKDQSSIDYITIPINSNKAKSYIKKDSFLSDYENYLSRNAGEILIDKDSDDIIGYIFVGKEIDEGFISTLEVRKKYRGQGFGAILLKDAINKYNAIDLEVKKDNKIAINLYKKYGFKVVSDGRNNKYYYMKLSK